MTRTKTIIFFLITLILLQAVIGCSKREFPVSIAVEGKGKVLSSLSGGFAAEGSSVTLTAVPDSGWEFSHWEGAISGGTESQTIVVDKDVRVKAYFLRREVSVKLSGSEGGTVMILANAPYRIGDVVGFEAAANPGWDFARWSGNSDFEAADASIEVKLTGDLEITGSFVKTSAPVALSVLGLGSIETDPILDELGMARIGKDLVLKAVPEEGWHLAEWQGSGSGNANPLVVEVTGKSEITAKFERDVMLDWRLSLGGEIFSSAASAHGKMYVGSSNGRLYCISGEGEKLWSFISGDKISASPAVGRDGTVYVGSWDRYFYAVTPDGEELWRYETGGGIASSAAVAEDGTVYVGSRDGNLYAFDPAGELLWSYKTGRMIVSSPVIGPEGTIYIGGMDKYLHAVSPAGERIWRVRFPFGIETNPAVGIAGEIFLGSTDGALYAISATGESLWKFMTDGEIYTSPAVGKEGTVYFGSDDYHLYAVDRSGDEIWRVKGGSLFTGTPTIGKSGAVYAGNDDNYLYAVREDGELLWKMKSSGAFYASPAFTESERLVIGSLDGYLYGFSVYDEFTDEAAPWPRIRGNSFNSGGL